MGNKLSFHKKRSERSSQTTTSDISRDTLTSSSHSSSECIFRNGRKFHGVESSAYWFPNDDEEIDRLVGQHFALKALFQGNILDIGLPFIPLEENARILDVGCGPGTWIMDIATEYPTSEFIGIDMCDVFPTNIRPPNVTFQVGNVLERLPFPDNSFDFVNIRLFIIALKKEQWPIVFAELFRVTKPGGCIQSTEAGMLNRGNEFVLRAGLEFENAIDRLGQDPHVAKKLGMLVEQAGFDVLHHEIKDAPLRGSDRLNREFLWDIAMIFKTGEQMLLGPLGLTSEEYPQFLDRLCKECQKLPEAKWCFGLCFGRKPVQ